jgi:SAM-dependent methyltransferase
VFGLITLPAFLSRHQGRTPTRGLGVWKNEDESIGRNLTARILKGLKKRLDYWAPSLEEGTTWSLYDQTGESYDLEGLQAKQIFIQESLDSCRPRTVLDLGCNTGRYSKLAAKAGAKVVAVDGDSACIGYLWNKALSEKLDILPLVMDLGRPSPALGWENTEEMPFLERASGRFDMVLALALIHHLLVRERLPLARIVCHLAKQTTSWVIIEWVSPEDPQFVRLAGTDSKLYAPLTQMAFESAVSAHFQIHKSCELLGGTRHIYLLKLKTC